MTIGSSPYREQGGTPLAPQLQPGSLVARFKAYLMMLEMLVLDLPSIIEELEDRLGADELALKRLKIHLDRINETSRL